jgi:GTP-binding protein HflX
LAIGRQVGVILNRKGRIEHVIVGDTQKLELPDLGRHRAGRGRLRGVRLIHTHLKGEALTRDDLTDLALLQLDYVAAIEVLENGLPGKWYGAHVVAVNDNDRLWEVLPPLAAHEAIRHDFEVFIRDLESQLARQSRALHVDDGKPAAILVQVVTSNDRDPEGSLVELRELAATAGVRVADVVTQRRPSLHPRTCLGRGRLDDLTLRSMQLGVEVAIFDCNLTPTQVRSIADATELKVLDRTQLILDIFAQRARSRAGKLQVELAQLKYRLPRLSQRDSAFSRLAGGIGGRGPGEQKLEIDRRRVKQRITLLNKELKRVGKARAQRRRKRQRTGAPVVSIVGYTNAGKSTLLNTMTKSDILVENKLFATLDPTSRRLRFPQEREVIITDTVGFIRDLPEDLIQAFHATLEEMEDADLLLHVIDVSNPAVDDQIEAVDRLLEDLDLHDRPTIRVLNKIDRLKNGLDPSNLAERFDGIPVSALNATTLTRLLSRIEHVLWQLDREPPALYSSGV